MTSITRRAFLAGTAMSMLTTIARRRVQASTATLPNIVLIMADDLGYGDTGFNGGTTIKTPHLDTLRAEGMRFTRFYAGAPVCSPTRGTCLTGRHYMRYGINHANDGCLPRPEITVAEVCRAQGYATGHFGKWHLGTLTREGKDGNRGGASGEQFYSPPWEHGFDTCFSTEALMPTWDPAITPPEGEDIWGVPGTPWRASYWNEQGERVTDNLSGDDSRVIVDRVEPFIRQAVAARRPFLAVVWFHAPHAPVVAGPEHRALYADCPEGMQHYNGCVTALDEQVGRLNRLLKDLAVDDHTMVWFASDNGPEGPGDGDPDKRFHGSTGGLRGRKRSLFNGGVGVPALLKWPGHVSPGSECVIPCSTLDYFPTIIDATGYTMPDSRPIDGISLVPMVEGRVRERGRPIPFRIVDKERYMFGSPTMAMMDDRYKVLTNLSEQGEEDMCFDMVADSGETKNLASEMKDLVARRREELRHFVESCRRSHRGEDYSEPYTPVTPFQELTGTWA